jgi:hypothetical protein
VPDCWTRAAWPRLSYSVDRDTLFPDVDVLLRDLEQQGLIGSSTT